jgi:oxygen-independent coproporphyrinogen-3 oxidase
MAYWQGRPYLGIGPSAHSYDGNYRSWNISNNSKYIKSIAEGELPLEREKLTAKDKYNEYVMTRLRTAQGISLNEVEGLFGRSYKEYLLNQIKPHLENHLLLKVKDSISVTKKGKFLSDGIAADLFLVNLES